MTLQEQQVLFSRDIGRLITYIYLCGYSCTLGEAYRTEEQAQWYADRGIGIKNSLHCKRLAIDLQLFLDGKYLNNSEDYHKFGCYWENLDAQNRWGGRFPRPDGNHFERKDL